MKKDWKRHIAYEVLVILMMLTLLMFLCRLWPIIFLLIIGIFITALRLLFLSPKRVEVVEPLPLPALPEPKEPTEQDVRDIAYSVILRRITELVTTSYPEARWVWEAPNARQLIELGEDVFILLNRAGGYRRAHVVIQNLQVVTIEYNCAPATPIEHRQNQLRLMTMTQTLMNPWQKTSTWSPLNGLTHTLLSLTSVAMKQSAKE